MKRLVSGRKLVVKKLGAMTPAPAAAARNINTAVEGEKLLKSELDNMLDRAVVEGFLDWVRGKIKGGEQ